MYIRLPHENRGRWPAHRSVVFLDTTVATVSVPGSSGKTVSAAFEDVRPSIIDDQFDLLSIQANNGLDSQLDRATDTNTHPALDDTETAAITQDSSIRTDERDPPYSVVHTEVLLDSSINLTHAPLTTGDRINVFWPIDNAFHACHISELHPSGSHSV